MTKQPDFEGFARAVVGEWPVNRIEGPDLWDLALEYGMVREVPGGFDPFKHKAPLGLCPGPGDEWYELNFPRQTTDLAGKEATPRERYPLSEAGWVGKV